MIGIIGAMEIEVRTLIETMTDVKEEKISGSTFYKGTLDGKSVVVAQSGIGKVAAAICAESMILRYSPALLINTGVAGSLTSELNVTDVAVADRAVQHDMDTSPLGDPVGLISGINKIYFEAEKKAVDLFLKEGEKLGVKVKAGLIASGDQFIAGAEKKNAILSLFPDAVACEMEGAAIAHVAYLNNTPFVTVRAISDCADGSSPMDYPSFVAKAAKTSFAMTRAFVAAYN
ncbi:MAG: 5'-methylthioadenosine/adenosylhomocysteine nucleosidase [Clostridia bacterium]|nr:5'-methylthioadenosine/adenosylhomocysteine nucleosidase [Clostridia bacterium]